MKINQGDISRVWSIKDKDLDTVNFWYEIEFESDDDEETWMTMKVTVPHGKLAAFLEKHEINWYGKIQLYDNQTGKITGAVTYNPEHH